MLEPPLAPVSQGHVGDSMHAVGRSAFQGLGCTLQTGSTQGEVGSSSGAGQNLDAAPEPRVLQYMGLGFRAVPCLGVGDDAADGDAVAQHADEADRVLKPQHRQHHRHHPLHVAQHLWAAPTGQGSGHRSSGV